MTDLRLGKQPATKDSRDFKLASYLTAPKLKTAPKGYGHQGLVQKPWGMLANDRWGDCAVAGPMHAAMLWNAAAGRQISFTSQEAVQTYSNITGFDEHAGPPGQNPTDRGTNMRDALKYRQKVGLVDSDGHVHKIGAYLSISPKDTTALLRALYLFEAVEIGFEFPASAMTQFNQGRPWSLVPGSPNIGGHDVPLVGRPTAEGLLGVTWGRLQRMTFGFYRSYNDEAWVVVSEEMLTGGRSLEGFDLMALNADLAAL